MILFNITIHIYVVYVVHLYNLVYCPFRQNMEKTDVNQIYGDYYFSDEGEVIVDSNNFDVKPQGLSVSKKSLSGNRREP